MAAGFFAGAFFAAGFLAGAFLAGAFFTAPFAPDAPFFSSSCSLPGQSKLGQSFHGPARGGHDDHRRAAVLAHLARGL